VLFFNLEQNKCYNHPAGIIIKKVSHAINNMVETGIVM